MNIYADRGNLIVLERRCAWRGIGFELTASGLGDELDPGGHDLFYIGGGQDRDQRLCADDLLETKARALRQAAGRGAVILGVCGGYQLLGRSYTLGQERIEGVGLLDLETVREEGQRLIGNVAIEPTELPGAGPGTVLAGFENHGGRTRLAPGQARSAVCCRVTATTGAAGSRAPSRGTRSARTCMARCCPRTSGSPTG